MYLASAVYQLQTQNRLTDESPISPSSVYVGRQNTRDALSVV